MTKLPEELIRPLTDHRSTLAPLALVNKYYNRVVTPILYDRVSLGGSYALKAFSDALVTRRPILRQYPRSLDLCYYPKHTHDDLEDIELAIKEMLMHAPNITELGLAVNPPTTRYLLKDPHYPFRLHTLRMIPTKDALLIEFLKTQPQIKHVTFMPDSGDADLYFTPGWERVPSPLDPRILPNLNSIEVDTVHIPFLVPDHPIKSVYLFRSQEDLELHEVLARSAAPLERLSECIQIWEIPWETGIVSRCFPSLKFCQTSLREYSLEIVGTDHRLITRSSRGGPSYGLSIIRENLSKFPQLRKFRLNYHIDWYNDLTPEFCEKVPELSRFEVWRESCPNLEEITLFGITLAK